MRSFVKTASPFVAAALVLSACGGTTGGNTTDDQAGSGGGGKKCNLAIGFFGALTGDAANLGKNIKNGVQLAVDQHNKDNADCKVTLKEYDSQGDPAQAPGLASKAISEKDVVGLVGPAFSGESKAANPLFAEAGLVHITPSATNPALAENGWKTFFRVLGNDASQGPAAAKYIKDVLKAKSVFVVDDASEYGKGLADIVREDLGGAVKGKDTIQQKQTDFSATVTAIRSSKADAVFFGGYYAEAGLLVKQLREGNVKARFVVADGVKDEGYITAGGEEATEGTIITCPCLPPDQASGTFAQDYQAAFNSEPATYSAEGYDAAKVLLDAITEGKTSREDILGYVKAYNKPGVTKTIKFDEKGEPAEVSVWAYKVEGGKIMPDQEVK